MMKHKNDLQKEGDIDLKKDAEINMPIAVGVENQNGYWNVSGYLAPV